MIQLVHLISFGDAAPPESGSHPYHGPTKDGASIPDPTHERFHGAVGDVIAGKILPAARRQMQDALAGAPKEAAPFPLPGAKDDPRRIGWRV